MPFRLPAVMFFFLMWSFESSAQSILHGKVFELNTKIAIPGTMVINLSDQSTVLTDTAGRFAITATSGDLLIFRSYAYLSDTILVINMKFREVYLQAVRNTLEEVTVKHTEIRRMNFRDPEYHGQTVVYQVDEKGNHKGGLSFRLWYWNKDSKKIRDAKKRMKTEEILLEIDRVFSAINISKYLPLRGKELHNFIFLYRPSPNIYLSGSFDLLLYINDSYKAFNRLPPEKRKLLPLKGSAP